MKHGGGGIIMWGCLSAPEATCCRMLLELSLERHFIIQHDNDPKHIAKIKDGLQEQFVNVVEWPSQSLDLNPIKHLWKDLKMSTDSVHPTSMNLTGSAEKNGDNAQKKVCQAGRDIPKKT